MRKEQAMKDKLLRFFAIGSVLIAVASLTIWSTGVFGKQQGNQPRKTLREIGMERHVETPVSDTGLSAEYLSLNSLTKASEAIVVGKITSEEAAFDGDDRIVTSYTVDVHSIIKDTQLNAPLPPDKAPPAPLQTPLKFVRAGGVIDVNGHLVSRKLRGSELLKSGKEYVLFLWWTPSFNSYYLAGGSSGAFLVRDNSNQIRPLGAASGMLKYEGMDLGAFVREVSSNR
jgi:hypothetical protein